MKGNQNGSLFCYIYIERIVMKNNLNEQVSRIKDMIKKLDDLGIRENDENKHYWKKWDGDPEGDDEAVEDMKSMVRNAVERGKISDTEGYEIENILDNDLESFAEYDSVGSGWFDKSEKTIDYKQTIRNIRKHLNNRN